MDEYHTRLTDQDWGRLFWKLYMGSRIGRGYENPGFNVVVFHPVMQEMCPDPGERPSNPYYLHFLQKPAALLDARGW